LFLAGCPTTRIWPEVTQLPLVANGTVDLLRYQTKYVYNTLKETLPKLHDHGIDLLHMLLTYNPAVRITARAALQHEYFYCSPYPQEADYMPTFPSQHDEMMKQKS
jgi:serine/threonine protein kinase